MKKNLLLLAAAMSFSSLSLAGSYWVETQAVSCNTDPSPCYASHCKVGNFYKGDIVNTQSNFRDSRGVIWKFEVNAGCWLSFKNPNWYTIVGGKAYEY